MNSTLETRYCIECGKQFSAEDMIRHDNAYVCAACKPRFLQKLSEGAEIRTSALRYAGIWRRFWAIVLDGLILACISTVLLMIAFGVEATMFGANEERSTAVVLLSYALQLVVGISYETFMIGNYGATIGKMACKISVVTPEGGAVSYLRAFGRYFGKILSSIILGIGYLMAAFDDERRTLHDRLCNTRVVLNK